MRDGNNVNYDIDTLTNRYDSVGGNNLTYDAAGNLTKDRQGYKYQYDYENRLTRITKDPNNTAVAEFSYDALGRRVKKTDSITSANTRCYYYNYNWQILSEFDGSGGYKKSFIYGNYIDEVLMSVGSAIATTHKYYLHDHLYSPVALTDNDGVVVERYEYDAYGKCYIMDAGYNPRSASLYGNPFMFTGRELDILDSGNLKIQYNRNRYYDYYTGRWITHDPLGITPNPQRPNRFLPLIQHTKGYNLYEYVSSNPIIEGDKHGLGWIEPGVPDEDVVSLCISLRSLCQSKVRAEGVSTYRNKGYAGHAGLLVDGQDIDFGPEGLFPFRTRGASPWRYGGPGEEGDGKKVEYATFSLYISRTGKLYGRHGLWPCCTVSTVEVKNCIRYKSALWNGSVFGFVGRNCRHFVADVIKNCCLEIRCEEKTTHHAPP